MAAAINSIVLPPGTLPSIIIACDGKSVLSKVNIGRENLQCKLKHIDLISIINNIWESSSFSIVKTHVYGHRDTAAQPLTPLETLNCRMDLLAKRIAIQYIHHNQHPPPILPTILGFRTIAIHGTPITSKIQQPLYYNIQHAKLLQWICQKSSPPINLISTNIHWPSFSLARKQTTFPIQIFITKWISSSLPTGSNLVKRKHRQFSNCPICNSPNEDLLHLVTCSNEEASTFRQQLLNEMVQWMESAKTHPNIMNIYSTGLSSFYKDTNFLPPLTHWIYSDDQSTNSALSSQINLGWMNTLTGFITEEMVNLQQNHYNHISSSKKVLHGQRI